MELRKSMMAALLFTAGTAFAASGQDSGKKFEDLDKDGDQNISQSEAKGEQKIVDSFSEIDKDQDQVISQNELKEWKSQKKEQKGQETAQQGQEGSQQSQQQMADQMIQKLDQDSDQNISRHEADQNSQLVEAFDDVDENSDGALSSEELSNWDDIQKAQEQQ